MSKNKKQIQKKQFKKRLIAIVDIIIAITIIFSVFELRRIYGIKFLGEGQTVETTNTVEQKPAVQEKVEKVKLTPQEINKEISKVVRQYQTENSKISVIYNNLSTGQRYAINETEYYPAASTTKVIYGMYIYDRIESGQINANEKIPYNENMLSVGGGLITNNPKKESYPLEEVLMNMLTYSDNTATNMLILNDANATQIVLRYFDKIGVSVDEEKIRDNKIMPVMMESIWLHLYKNQDKYSNIIKYLKDSGKNQNEWIKAGIPNKQIASKYGAVDSSLHDNAIVYGSSEDNGDYILIIYTEDRVYASTVIANIAEAINKIHDENA